MAVAWFLCPYKRDDSLTGGNHPTRYCAMNDFNPQIVADGGAWAETEVLGNQAIVKVRANAGTLNAIAGGPGFRRIPANQLDTLLSSLTAAQRQALQNELTNAGYTLAEVQAALGDLSTATLGQLLRFFATRRKKPRFDVATNTIVLDGPTQPCRPVDDVDARVT